MKPVLKWAGGKARLAERIDLAFRERCRGTYYEPFVGSSAVFLYRRAIGNVQRAVLADVNAKLVEMHRALRDDVRGVLDALSALPGDDWKGRFYAVREAYNDGPWTGAEHAARFLWLNRAAFNGLYRENRRGEFNVPIGRYAKLSFPNPAHFLHVSELLQGVDIQVSDFREIVDAARDGDQVYCDPPYVPLSATACFTGYSATPFGLVEQRALGLVARGAAERGARVVLSNHDHPAVTTDLYPLSEGFEHVARPRVARAISRSGAGRGAVGELIAAIGPMRFVA